MSNRIFPETETKRDSMFAICRHGQISPRVRRSAGVVLCAVLGLILGGGCSGPRRAEPVDVGLARSTLQRVLEHWQSGGTIDELRRQSPEIVVQEAFWLDGRSLVGFKLVDEGHAEDANWFCDVDLQLSAEDGPKAVRRTVTYAVGTDPVLTVFRAML